MSNHSFKPVPKWTECTCLKCETHFWLQPSRVKHGKGTYCSRACWVADMPRTRLGRPGLHRYGEANPNYRGRSATRICPVCNKGYNHPPAIKTCSKKCGEILRKSTISGSGNPYLKAHPAKVKTCHFCGNDYHASQGQQCGKYFCSNTCYMKGRSKSPRALWLNYHLSQLGYTVILEKSWTWLHRPGKIQRMRIDLYLPDHNLAIEYDGEHHFRRANGNTAEQFELIKERDRCKNQLLKENGIRLIRISEWPINLENLIAQI